MVSPHLPSLASQIKQSMKQKSVCEQRFETLALTFRPEESRLTSLQPTSKEGPSYDLPIALGILLASEQIQADVSKTLVTGELSLDGRVRAVSGVLSQVLFGRTNKFTSIFLPKDNSLEAQIVDGIEIIPVETLRQLFDHLSGGAKIEPVSHQPFEELVSEQL